MRVSKLSLSSLFLFIILVVCVNVVYAKCARAEFTVSDLSQLISIEEGADITIFVNLSNIGDIEGTHQVDLKLDGEVVYSINVTLPGGATKEVPLWIEGGLTVGTYQVEVEGLTGSFEVKTPPKPAEFVLSNFTYTFEIQEGEPLRMYVDIANVGEVAGETTIIIKIDGIIQSDLQSLFQLGPEEVFSQVWTTYEYYGPGTHTIELDGFDDRFSVIPEPVPFWDKIPGFPYESITLGLIAVIIILWNARKL